jgi:hypothetical protein
MLSKMQLLLVLSVLLPFVYCDTIKINSPTPNQVINNSSFLIDYVIERNDENNKLFVTNTTTELLDVRGNSLVAFPKNLTNSTMVRLDMRTFVQPNTITNFTVKITAFGNYSTPVNGRLFGEIETEVPLQLNLSNGTNSASTRPSTTSTSTASSTTTSTPTTSSNSNSTTATSTPTSEASKSNSAFAENSQLMLSLTAMLMMFLF